MSLPSAKWANAVCCSADHIFVAGKGTAAVHVFTWTGAYICSLSHDLLGLGELDLIYAINCSRGEPVLQLAVGHAGVTKSLHAYKVSECRSRSAEYNHEYTYSLL